MFFRSSKDKDKEEPLLSNTKGDWPSVLEECREMLEGSALMYGFADLRQLVRNEKLLHGDQERISKLMNLPVSATDVIKIVEENADILSKEFGDDSVALYLSAMQSIQEAIRRQGINHKTGEVIFQSSQVVVFDDENANTELVFGIALNTARKRVTVAFRGSVTVQDFLTDANAFLAEIPNPMVNNGAGIPQYSTIGVHHGFRDYLFGAKTKVNKGEMNKFEVVMTQVKSLLEQHPGYRLYVTGHSLGGALATLFAFEAAADPAIPKPVSCINVASPKVGNLAFRRAFQALEVHGHIRCLRVANHKDLVTLLPDRGNLSCLYIMCCQKHVYRHVGMELKLYRNKHFELKRPSDAPGYIGLFLRDWARQVRNAITLTITLPCICCCREDFIVNHSCKEYMERLQQNASKLEHTYLNHMYQHKEQLSKTE